MRASSLEIQRRSRGWLAKREAGRRRRHNTETAAALRIQAAWRGHQGRVVAGGVRAAHEARELAIAMDAALRIQRVWRGRICRREMAPWLHDARFNRERKKAEELAAVARIEAMR